MEHEKKYTIQLTFDELQHVFTAIENRQINYFNDYVEHAEENGLDKEEEEKQEKVLNKLYSRLKKKWDKI